MSGAQAVRDISVPEVPTFLPAWEHRSAAQAQAAGDADVEDLAPRQRVDAAAQAVPGAPPALPADARPESVAGLAEPLPRPPRVHSGHVPSLSVAMLGTVAGTAG